MTQITYYGHSAIGITAPSVRLLIDPFFTHNPVAPVQAQEVLADYILVTHGHDDHVGDAVAIAKRCGATIIANFELGTILRSEGAEVFDMHIGGSQEFPFGKVKLTIAHHGAGYGENAARYAGPPVGFLVTIDGKTFYHAGDTGLFMDMQLIGARNTIDCAFLPIGDRYTMGIDDAVTAAELLHAKMVIPIHYNTWPGIEADPVSFARRLPDGTVNVLKPGNSISL